MDGAYQRGGDFATNCDMDPVEFLQALTDGGAVNIVAIPPDGNPCGKTYLVGKSGPAIAKVIERARTSGYNVYYALNEPRAEFIGKPGKRSEENFACLRGLAVDLDPREEAEREPGGWARERERLMSLADALTTVGPCPASVAIDSGNGVQLIWLFAEPIENTRENRAAVKAQAAGLADALGGDAVHSVDHLFRLPGTRNFPNAKKRGKGRVETESQALHVDLSRRYTLAQLKTSAPPRDARATAPGDLIDFDYPTVLGAAEGGTDNLPPALQDRVADLRERRGFDAALANPDRSERDYALAAHCIGAGMTDPTEIACITFSLSPGKLLEKDVAGAGGDYACRTAMRALERAKRDPQPEDLFSPVEMEGGAATGASERTSKFFPASVLAGRSVPPRAWLVKELVPQNTVTLFGGDGGTGKSLLALQLAAGVAAGSGWLGKNVEPGNAIYISAEDDEDELHRRLADILRSAGQGFEDVANLTLRSLAGEDALLAVEDHVRLVETTLFKELDMRAGTDRPSLIVIDTLADVYPANENDRAKVRQFVGILRKLALRHSCAVMLLAHPSLSGLNSGSGTSGSTAWNNSVRSRLYLSRVVRGDHEPDPDKRILSTKKANYGPVGAEITLRWRGGVFEVASQVGHVEPGQDSHNKAERVFLKLLARRNEEGRFVSHNPGPTYAPKQFEDDTEGAENVRKNAFKAAMESLFRSRQIVVAEHGSGAKARKHIALTEGEKHA